MSYTPVRHPDEEKLCDFQAFFYLSTWTMGKHPQCISVGNSLAAFLKKQKKREETSVQTENEEASNGGKANFGKY